MHYVMIHYTLCLCAGYPPMVPTKIIPAKNPRPSSSGKFPVGMIINYTP